MQDGYVNSTTEGGIATVTFHHPKSNSLPGHILRGMAKAIEDAGKDPGTRVIILRSDGDKAFCAGASFDELVAIETEETGLAFFSGFAHVINAIRKAPVFVIGRIHSHAVGGGVGLACAVDIAYAHSSASARLSELAVGIGPFVVGPAVERMEGPAQVPPASHWVRLGEPRVDGLALERVEEAEVEIGAVSVGAELDQHLAAFQFDHQRVLGIGLRRLCRGRAQECEHSQQ